jgi:YgiT-type zinc finger domain-containing protein
MICDICGKSGARVRRTTRTFGTGRSRFLIEGVPVVHCPHCGESYLTAATLKEIERIRKGWRRLAVAKRVPVAKFKGAA